MQFPLVAAFADFQDCEEGFLRDVDAANALHAFFAFFLLLKQLALSGDVATVAFGEDVLSHGVDRFPSDDFGTN